jgi:hypothetical protein
MLSADALKNHYIPYPQGDVPKNRWNYSRRNESDAPVKNVNVADCFDTIRYFDYFLKNSIY